MGDPFAKRQVDAGGMVDEEAQRFLARLLERDQIELGIELTELLLNVLLEVCHWVEAQKKWARPTSGTSGLTKA
jgi:hypothetical protein